MKSGRSLSSGSSFLLARRSRRRSSRRRGFCSLSASSLGHVNSPRNSQPDWSAAGRATRSHWSSSSADAPAAAAESTRKIAAAKQRMATVVDLVLAQYAAQCTKFAGFDGALVARASPTHPLISAFSRVQARKLGLGRRSSCQRGEGPLGRLTRSAARPRTGSGASGDRGRSG